jgi:hypothetical protein
MDTVCENPACPQDKTGQQLASILEAQDTWIAKMEMEDLWRKAYPRVYVGDKARG